MLDADVRDFLSKFDQVWLMKFLEHRIADRRVLRLIQNWLCVGILEDGKWYGTLEGTPQGSAISPLLENLFLHYAFDVWMARNFPDCPFQRYADDGVIHCATEQEAKEILVALGKRLAELGLELNPDSKNGYASCFACQYLY